MHLAHVISEAKQEKYEIPGESIRSTMKGSPLMQRFLTWLTAVPMFHEQASSRGPLYQVGTAFLSMVIGLLISSGAVYWGGACYLLLCLGLLLTVSGVRKLQVVIYHHCAHGTVFQTRKANFILGEVISIALMIKDFDTYKKDHMAHHNAQKLLTYEDETAQDLAEIGILPGVPVSLLWRRLLCSFISPFAHARWMIIRIKSCLLSLNTTHNILALTYWVGLSMLINYLGLWKYFLLIWIFPLTILYHISRILRLAAEHRWPSSDIKAERSKIFTCLSTVAVFNGEAAPSKRGNLVVDTYNLSCWMMRMVFIHLFTRIFVLVGDTPCHDFHHRRPSSREWSNYVYARQKDKEAGCPGYPLNYTEVWGLFNAINQNLSSISNS